MNRGPAASILAAAAAAAMAGATLLAGCESAGPSGGKAEAAWGRPGTETGCFVKPRGLAADLARGRIYVADMSGRLQKFDLDGNFLASWNLPDSKLGTSEGLAVTAGGDVLVADTHYHRVLRFSPKGEQLGSFGEYGDGPGQFYFPVAVTVDAAGNIYVSEYGGNDRVQKFSPRGGFLLQLGSFGRGPGQLFRPSGLAIDKDGNVLVADAANHRIQRFSPEGRLLAAWGRQGGGPGELNYPYDVAALPDGSVAVLENYNHRVQRFSSDGRPLGIVGGPGREAGEFSRPWCLAAGTDGVLWISDTMNHRIQKLRFQLSVASCQLPVVSGQLLTLATGNWQLATRSAER